MMLRCNNLLFTKIAAQPPLFAYQISISLPFFVDQISIVYLAEEEMERIGDRYVVFAQTSALCEEGQCHDQFPRCRCGGRSNVRASF